jgi:hypothetical protein
MKTYLNVVACVLIFGFIIGIWAENPLPVHTQSKAQTPGESVIDYYTKTSIWQRYNFFDPSILDTAELYWDDGVPEAYFVVRFPPCPNDRMAVRFTPPYSPPMKVIGGRFYTNNWLPFRSFSVCRDAGGYPDVFHPVDYVDSIGGGNPGWGNYQFHGALFDSNDIWAVVEWIPGNAVGIGADSTAPDNSSYYSTDPQAQNWVPWTATDWMMRLSVATVTDSHDVSCVSIIDPPGIFLPGDTAHPTAVFGNCGLSPETFDVTFDILDSTNNVIYSSTNNITLVSSEVETLTFTPEWVETIEGMYTYKAYTSLAGDIDPLNDTIRMQGLCTREIVITYCGDYTNMGSAIIGTWATNRKYMVRMTPPIPPPFYIRRAQVYLCDANAPLDYLCVCPDDGTGLPDTATILAIANNISVPVIHTWATANYGEIEVTQPGDLWVISKWPEGITEPHIGMEINQPSSERSWRYYYRNGSGHYENLGLDPYFREWYYRLIIAAPPLGIAEHKSEQPAKLSFHCTPNPFSKLTSISVCIGQNTSMAPGSTPLTPCLKIYNVTGKLVRQWDYQTIGQSDQITWDGSDKNGQKLPSGVYFIMLEAPEKSLTAKIIRIE